MHILNMIKSFFRKKQLSDSVLTYIGVTLMGLGMAKFTISALLFLFNPIPKDLNLSASNHHKITRNQSINNISALTNGILYKRAIVSMESKNPEEINKEEAKEFSLLGTLSGHWTIARAIIQVKGSKEPTKEYAIGQKIGSAKIIYIGRGYIWYRQNGQKIKLTEGENTTKAQKQHNKKIAAVSGGTVKKFISRAELKKYTNGNLAAIYKGASFGPYIKGGKIVGFKIHKVKPSHIFYKLGARSKDIIQSVNGFSLSNQERMFELWKTIKTANNIKVDILRKKQKIRYEFIVQN